MAASFCLFLCYGGMLIVTYKCKNYQLEMIEVVVCKALAKEEDEAAARISSITSLQLHRSSSCLIVFALGSCSSHSTCNVMEMNKCRLN